jgi:hypothetical protein
MERRSTEGSGRYISPPELGHLAQLHRQRLRLGGAGLMARVRGRVRVRVGVGVTVRVGVRVGVGVRVKGSLSRELVALLRGLGHIGLQGGPHRVAGRAA